MIDKGSANANVITSKDSTIKRMLNFTDNCIKIDLKCFFAKLSDILLKKNVGI